MQLSLDVKYFCDYILFDATLLSTTVCDSMCIFLL